MWPLSGFNRKKEDLIQKSHETPPGENAISTCPTRTATSCRLLVLYNDLESIAFADEGRMPVSVEMEHAGDHLPGASWRRVRRFGFSPPSSFCIPERKRRWADGSAPMFRASDRAALRSRP